MILNQFAVVGLVGRLALGVVLLAAALWHPTRDAIQKPGSWKNYRFGFATYTLIFVASGMEMIFMYPWAVVFAKTDLKAFLDILVFIGLLSAGITYAWGMGGLKWDGTSGYRVEEVEGMLHVLRQPSRGRSQRASVSGSRTCSLACCR